MPNWKRTTFAFLAGFVLCAAGVAAKQTFAPKADGPTGLVPWNREGLAIVEWMMDHHPKAPDLHIVAVWPPVQVKDNPFTHEPSTLVRMVVRKGHRPVRDPIEELSFYLKGGLVLGYVPTAPDGEIPEPSSLSPTAL
jgi:hypothetical protein